MNHLEQAITDIEQQLAAIEDLEKKAALIQADLDNTSVKELEVFNNESLDKGEKTRRLIELRTLAEVVLDSLNKTKLELYAAEDNAVNQGIQVNYMLGSFRDQLRAEAIETANEEINKLLKLDRGEDAHFSHRAHTVHNIDRVESISFVRNNRIQSLQALAKLSRIYAELKALA